MLFDHVYCTLDLVGLFLLTWYVCLYQPRGSTKERACVRDPLQSLPFLSWMLSDIIPKTKKLNSFLKHL